MIWTAPDVERADPPYIAGERSSADAWLDYHRATLLHKCAGLTGEQLAQRPIATSALSLLGLVRHMAGNERIWFRIRFAGADIEDLHASPGHPAGAEFDLADPAAAESDFAAYAAEVRAVRMALAGRSLDETGGRDPDRGPALAVRAHDRGVRAS
jgi:hypothetical protein